MVARLNRYELQTRYVFQGQLIMQTALHIGGGKVTLSGSDSPVVLTPEEIPFIPGSSFKGALRSTVEKLVPGLPGDLFSCGLIELNDQEETEAQKEGRRICSTARQKAIVKKRRDNPGQEAEILRQARADLCNTCQLFGSPYAASSINVNDLYMPNREWAGIIQRRDGVAIDRDSEKAKDRLKYDFEVVPASATFNLEISLENATTVDLQLISIGLSEFVRGFGAIGGKRSRGLGVCHLTDLTVSSLVLTDLNKDEHKKRLRDYLLRGSFSEENIPGEQFFARYIEGADGIFK